MGGNKNSTDGCWLCGRGNENDGKCHGLIHQQYLRLWRADDGTLYFRATDHAARRLRRRNRDIGVVAGFEHVARYEHDQYWD